LRFQPGVTEKSLRKRLVITSLWLGITGFIYLPGPVACAQDTSAHTAVQDQTIVKAVQGMDPAATSSSVDANKPASKLSKQSGQVLTTGKQLLGNAPETRQQTIQKQPPSQKEIEFMLASENYKHALEMIREDRNEEALAILAPYAAKPINYPKITSDYLTTLIWAGKRDEAIKKFENLPSKFPRKAFLLRNMAKAYYDKQNFVAAASLYGEALQLLPSDMAAQQGLVLSTLYSGYPDNAAFQLDKFLLKKPESPLLKMAKPLVLFAQQKYALAMQAFRSLLESRDTHKESIYRDRKNAVLSLSVENRRELLAQLRQASKAKGGSALKDYVLALVLNRHYRSATKAFDAAIDPKLVQLGQETASTANTTSPMVDDEGRQAIFNAVESWRVAWSSKDQENYFRAYAVDFAPTHPSSLSAWKKYKKRLFSSRAYMRVKIDSINIEMLETSHHARVRFQQQYDASNYHSLDTKELLLTRKGDEWKIVREHIISDKQVVKTGTSMSPYELNQIAWAYFKTGAYRKSRYYYQEILLANADDVRANTGMAYNLAMEGEPDKAIAILDRLLKKQPNNIDVRYARAYVFERQKKFGLVASEYERILSIAPDAKAAQSALVLALVHAGRTDQAAKRLHDFLQGNPDYLQLILTEPDVLIGQQHYGEALKTYHRLAGRKDVDQDRIFRKRDSMITSLSVNQRRSLLAALDKETRSGNQEAMRDLILVQTLSRQYRVAIESFEKSELPYEKFSPNELSWIAWSYFKVGNTEKSKAIYLKVLSNNPDYLRANIGMAYNLAFDGNKLQSLKRFKEANTRIKKATAIVNVLVARKPKDVEAHFARAYVFEQKSMFWDAMLEYDQVLWLAPGNLTALKLRMMALSYLGASSVALEQARKQLPKDIKLQEFFKGDMVVDSLHWDEFRKARKTIPSLMVEKGNLRPRFDFIVAAAENRDMQDAVNAYEQLVQEEIQSPYWLLENIGRAYLYLKQPDKALDVYNQALKLNPRSYNARFGKFYVLQENRKWNDADKILEELDKEYKWNYWAGKQKRSEPKKLEIAIARGWKLAYEDRLDEAEEYFLNLHRRAPANIAIRSAIAYIYMFRGWPRKALMEFQIIETMDPENLEARIGKIRALNELEFKEEARQEKNAILHQPGKAYYKRTGVQKLDRDLLLEEKFRVGFDFVYENSNDNSSDYLAILRLAEPLTLHTDLTAYVLRRRTAQFESVGQFDRVGLGIDHTFNSDWRAAETISFDTSQGSEFGFLTELFYTPDDHWKLEASYDTFAVDIALRARAFGIRGRKASAGITYRQSEWREMSFGYTHWDFSDKNKRDEGLLRYEQGLWVRNDWRQRLYVEYYLGRNSLLNRPYFNPHRSWSLTGTLMTQQTLWDIYNRKFLHKLFLTAGNYNQSGFGSKEIMIIRYQQEIDFSDTQALLWGITWARQPYDGIFVDTRNIYLTYDGKF